MQGNGNSLTTEAFCLPDAPPVASPNVDSQKTEAGKPTRSQIAPIAELAGNFPPHIATGIAKRAEKIEDLLKNLGPKTASTALKNAAMLEKLPLPQRMALKQALRAIGPMEGK